MLESINRLIAMDIRDIIKSGECTLLLLKMYSLLFLNGGQPGNCESCLRKYHNEIIKHGKMKAEIAEKIKNRTLIPGWNGLRYIPGIVKNGKYLSLHAHIHSDTLTDEQAVKYLNSGALKESDFKKLPEEKIKKSQKTSKK